MRGCLTRECCEAFLSACAAYALGHGTGHFAHVALCRHTWRPIAGEIVVLFHGQLGFRSMLPLRRHLLRTFLVYLLCYLLAWLSTEACGSALAEPVVSVWGCQRNGAWIETLVTIIFDSRHKRREFIFRCQCKQRQQALESGLIGMAHIPR